MKDEKIDRYIEKKRERERVRVGVCVCEREKEREIVEIKNSSKEF